MQRAIAKLFSSSGIYYLKNYNSSRYMKTSEAPMSAYYGICQKILKELESSQFVQSF